MRFCLFTVYQSQSYIHLCSTHQIQKVILTSSIFKKWCFWRSVSEKHLTSICASNSSKKIHWQAPSKAMFNAVCVTRYATSNVTCYMSAADHALNRSFRYQIFLEINIDANSKRISKLIFPFYKNDFLFSSILTLNEQDDFMYNI